ncbi:MAG: glutathione S-transferase family protein [Gammaproteobacteria bacterium]|nr:glutathione S-transferase family protein [Gammaproteobacteria bacterium]
MGLLVDGKWHDVWYETAAHDGRFVRDESRFRNWVTVDGQPGPTGRGGFRAEPDRYHLYVSLACPWAHRTLIMRQLKDLEHIISISVVNALMRERGWTFEPGPGVIADHVNHAECLHEIYTLANPDYSGRVTVPVLWDKKSRTIVSNESADIMRMLNSAFDGLGAAQVDYFPEELRSEIESLNEFIYPHINNGVYRAGFATTQEAYAEAVGELFDALDVLDDRLSRNRYLTGTRITEADWRLFTTLVRFDPVYFGHFKCNKQPLRDYPNLWGYVCDLFQITGVAETVDIPYIKQHYYGSHTAINPTGIVPVGPHIDYRVPHDRERLLTVSNSKQQMLA